MSLELVLKEITKDTNIFDEINIKKSKILERLKPSTKENILYFIEDDLKNIPSGFSNYDIMNINATPFVGKRSLLEYLPMQRQPIPYCVIRCNNKYFLTYRKSSGGELRLVGDWSLLGGHIENMDISFSKNNCPDKVLGRGLYMKFDLTETIKNALYRELEEETTFNRHMIHKIDYLGVIKIEEENSVENDHLGFIYLIDINDEEVEIVEKDILEGKWLTEEEIKELSLERWSQMIMDKIIE